MKDVIFQEVKWHSNRSFHVYVYPGEKIEIHTRDGSGTLVAIKSFVVGDIAEYDSFNLKYTGQITSITGKNVIIQPRHDSRSKRLNFEVFSWRNFDFDAVRVARENWETSSYI